MVCVLVTLWMVVMEPRLIPPSAGLHHGHHRREAVRGARRRGDDLVLRDVVVRVVHAVHDVQHGVARVLDGRGDEHALDALGEKWRERVARQELAGALEHELDAVLVPVHRAGGGLVGVRDTGDLLAVVHLDGAVHERATVRPLPVDGIVLREVSAALARPGELVDVHELQLGVIEREAEREAPDAAEAVDANFDHRACECE
jgi:hypothetical protein